MNDRYLSPPSPVEMSALRACGLASVRDTTNTTFIEPLARIYILTSATTSYALWGGYEVESNGEVGESHMSCNGRCIVAEDCFLTLEQTLLEKKQNRF